MSRKYTIGEMAAIMGISVQTLRLYSDMGLIAPCYINPETGAFDMQAAHLMAYCHGQYFKLGEAIGRFGWSVKKK